MNLRVIVTSLSLNLPPCGGENQVNNFGSTEISVSRLVNLGTTTKHFSRDFADLPTLNQPKIINGSQRFWTEKCSNKNSPT